MDVFKLWFMQNEMISTFQFFIFPFLINTSSYVVLLYPSIRNPREYSNYTDIICWLKKQCFNRVMNNYNCHNNSFTVTIQIDWPIRCIGFFNSKTSCFLFRWSLGSCIVVWALILQIVVNSRHFHCM